MIPSSNLGVAYDRCCLKTQFCIVDYNIGSNWAEKLISVPETEVLISVPKTEVHKYSKTSNKLIFLTSDRDPDEFYIDPDEIDYEKTSAFAIRLNCKRFLKKKSSKSDIHSDV